MSPGHDAPLLNGWSYCTVSPFMRAWLERELPLDDYEKAFSKADLNSQNIGMITQSNSLP